MQNLKELINKYKNEDSIKGEFVKHITNDVGINSRRVKSWWIKNNLHHVYDKFETFVNNSEFVNQKRNVQIWAYLSDTKEIPKCKVCDNELKYNVAEGKFGHYCKKHLYHDGSFKKQMLDKKNQTMIKKYGTVKNFSDKSFTKATKQTMKDKYGVNENIMESKAHIEKIKQTHMKLYGQYYTKTTEYNKKRKQTSLSKYGETHHMKTQEFKNLFSSQSSNYKGWKEMKDFIIDEYVMKNTPKQELAEKCGYSLSHFNKIILNLGLDGDLPQNKINYGKIDTSIFEKDVREFIESNINTEIIYNDRQTIGQEIDIFLPEFKLGIECNGLYWHSEKIRGKNYHVNKTNLAEKHNINLFQLWEYDWNHKKQIVQSMIRNKLNLSKRIWARKCTVKSIDNKTEKNFLNENHLSGHAISSIKYGLFLNEELLMCMTVSKSRFEKNTYEIIRLSTKLNTVVVGGASKLLNMIERGLPKNSKLVSYADRNHSYSNFYEHLGFEFVENTKPNYWYSYQYVTLENRMNYQKKNLPSIFKNFDESLTEYENMCNNGYDRIWGSGNSKWIKTLH